MLSFIIPAHNEEQHVGAAVAAVIAAGRDSGQPYEVIVVDDASTDQMATIATQHGARVIHVHHRHIAATRNAGLFSAEFLINGPSDSSKLGFGVACMPPST